jgi:glucose-1-phosphate adenylyltransferase
MGIYMFEWSCLVEALREYVGLRQLTDFGGHVMPALLEKRRIMTHRFSGYWRDVGTISSYFDASMNAIDPRSGLDLDAWEICTSDDNELKGDRPPSAYGSQAVCRDALVSEGSLVEGSVARSILSSGVEIAEGARVEDSVLMQGVRVGPGAVVSRAVVDKDVQFGSGAVVRGTTIGEPVNPDYAKCDLDGLVLVGKGASLPPGVQLGANVVVEAGVGEAAFASQEVQAGSTIRLTGS